MRSFFLLRRGGKCESVGPGPGQYNVTGLSAKGKYDLRLNKLLII